MSSLHHDETYRLQTREDFDFPPEEKGIDYHETVGQTPLCTLRGRSSGRSWDPIFTLGIYRRLGCSDREEACGPRRLERELALGEGVPRAVAVDQQLMSISRSRDKEMLTALLADQDPYGDVPPALAPDGTVLHKLVFDRTTGQKEVWRLAEHVDDSVTLSSASLVRLTVIRALQDLELLGPILDGELRISAGSSTSRDIYLRQLAAIRAVPDQPVDRTHHLTRVSSLDERLVQPQCFHRESDTTLRVIHAGRKLSTELR
ncbi:uncharacterized protein B0H18DRAFT_1121998 [Fomitopsis serialis]|uniref:uncharacterized protein n=1 Tax=Fomitopsis serialis TaxID=139415 RepID=UPI0020085E35|nr:uncharacterized protein B0H18DRAFT_1121998 [Neoantrodia serialis]KAH9920406.1 hypothetical protein B0H18DRAFT_1121998 [Neoantrodia serialis]